MQTVQAIQLRQKGRAYVGRPKSATQAGRALTVMPAVEDFSKENSSSPQRRMSRNSLRSNRPGVRRLSTEAVSNWLV
jgi:hypothetical protein